MSKIMLLFKIFVILSIIFPQSDFQIDKFYEYPSESPFLTFDHINNTAYYFNIYKDILNLLFNERD